MCVEGVDLAKARPSFSLVLPLWKWEVGEACFRDLQYVRLCRAPRGILDPRKPFLSGQEATYVRGVYWENTHSVHRHLGWGALRSFYCMLRKYSKRELVFHTGQCVSILIDKERTITPFYFLSMEIFVLEET